MAKKTSSGQSQAERMRRDDPERETADRRATHHIMLMAKKPNGKKTSRGPKPQVSGSVQQAISSMVRQSSAFIEDQITAGRNAAERMRHGMTNTGQLNANINTLAESLVAVTRDIGVTWLELLSMIVRLIDTQAPPPGGAGGGGISRAPPRRGGTVTHTAKSGGATTLSSITAADAETPAVPPHIVVRGKKAKSVALDLRPSSARFVPHVRHLLATDRKHSLTAKFSSSSDPLRLVLVVEVPDGQHPGTYTGAVVDSSTNEPGGTVSVTVAK
jgi:hypothetical protein